jgi:hypothetical protein
MARFVLREEAPTTPPARFVLREEPAPAPVGRGESFVRGAVQGATVNLSDELAGKTAEAGARLQAQADASLPLVVPGPRTLAKAYPGVPYPEAQARWRQDELARRGYANLDEMAQGQNRAFLDPAHAEHGRDVRDAERARNSAAYEANKGSYIVGGVAGGLPTAVAAPVTRAAAGAPLLARMGASAKAAVPVGAAYGFGGSEADSVPGVALDTASGAGLGYVAGGALTAAGAGFGKVARAAARRLTSPSAAELAAMADQAVQKAQAELQRDGVELTSPQLSHLHAAVEESLKAGKTVDAAALARRLDFEALGMKPTLGQITRDPATYSREKNLRGVAGVGEPLLQRFSDQSRRMQEVVGDFSRGAQDSYGAGDTLIRALQNVDAAERAPIAAAYGLARDQAGRSAAMESGTFSRLANGALDEQMLSAALPVEARKILNDVTLGRIPLTVNSAEMIKTRLSGMARDLMAQGKKEGALAVGKLRDALERTPIEGGAGVEAKAAFDAARSLAKDRFSKLEAVPALKAAAEGDVYAQDFVGRYLLGGKAEEVSALAKVLPADAKAEARRQLGAALGESAFGQNVAGDAAFSPERFSRFLSQPGMRQKLAAFFSPEEMATLDRVQRVGAYRSSFPADSTVNTSNTAAAAFNLLSKIPGLPQSLGLLTAAKNAATNHMAVRSSVAAVPPQAVAGLSPSQEAAVINALRKTAPAGAASRNALLLRGGGLRLPGASAEEGDQ